MVEQQLVARERADGAIEIVDQILGAPIMRLEAGPHRSSTIAGPSGMAAVASLGAFAQTLAPVAAIVAGSARSGGMRVIFTPEVQRALADGTMRLVESSTGAMPTAVNTMGRFVETARVVPGAATGGIAALSGAGLAMALLPAAVAGAVAYANQRHLDQKLKEIREAVDAVHQRMQNDDWGTLEAGAAIVSLLGGLPPHRDIPQQLRLELAVARQEVERVYRSRRIEVRRRIIDVVRKETEGRSDPWQGEVSKIFDKKGLDILIAQYLEAMVVRAKLTTATSLALAFDGEGEFAVRMLEDAQTELHGSYEELYRVMAKLAGKRPAAGIVGKITRDDGSAPWRRAKGWRDELEKQVGSQLKARQGEVAVELDAPTLAALAPALDLDGA